MFFTKIKFRKYYRRFKQPFVERFWQFFKRVKYKPKQKILKLINKIYHHCQIEGNVPQRFKFILKDENDVNYKIIIDVIYLNYKPTF